MGKSHNIFIKKTTNGYKLDLLQIHKSWIFLSFPMTEWCGSSGEDVSVNAVIIPRNWGTISDGQSLEEGIAAQFVVMSSSWAGSSHSLSWRVFSSAQLGSAQLGSCPFSAQLEIKNWRKTSQNFDLKKVLKMIELYS